MTAAPLLPELRLDGRAPVDEVRAFFARDRLLAAYALADLDPAAGDTSRWWVARREGEIAAVVLLVDLLPFRPCVAVGDPEALAALFREAVRESRVVVAAAPAARLAIESAYRFERCDRMYRMAVDSGSFRPRVSHAVVRLGPDRLGDIIDLYGNASRSYFTPTRLERQIYFGVYLGGSLVSAAGTHVRSASEGVAAVGNVLTRLAYRGRGLATSCTSAVAEAALNEHRDVVLNVRQDNEPAIAVYKRLGFRVHAPFIEGPAVRRSGFDRISRVFNRRGIS